MKTTSLAPLITSAKTEKLVGSAYRALYGVLRLFGRNINGEVLLNLVTRALVDIAYEEIAEERSPAQRKNKITLTDLGLKTGIDTRTIGRLQQTPLRISEDDISPEAAILSRWSKDPALCNPITGRPKDLILYGRCGTFQGLVLSIAGRGISATAVVERLVARGNVQLVDQHYVRLLNPVWQFMEDGEDELLSVAASTLSTLAKSLRESIVHGGQYGYRPDVQRVFSHVASGGRHDALQKQLEGKVEALRAEFMALACEQEPADGDGTTGDGAAENDKEDILGFSLYLLRQQGTNKSTE